jgi:hypothetical protein
MKPLFEKTAYATKEEARKVTKQGGNRVRIESHDGSHCEVVDPEKAGDHLVNYFESRSKTASAHVDTRLKKRQRGFHFEKEPGFFDLKGKFDDAAKKNEEIKVAAIADALALFGLDPKYAGDIAKAADPVKALTQTFHQQDFGFGLAPTRPAGRANGEFVSFGGPSGLSGGDSFDRQPGAVGAGMQSGTGMSYGGV